MMEDQSKMKTEIGLQEQNTILTAWNDLKDSIFNVLFVLLDKQSDEEEETIFGLIFESGLDYLQMMAFPFNTAVIGAWNGGVTLNNISGIFGRFNVSSYLPNVTFTAFLLMLYSLIMVIILVLVDIIYVSYSFSKKKFRFTFPLVFLAQIVPLFVTVFFLPITETLLSVVQCEDPGNGQQVMTSFPNINCWEGWHLFHAAITLLFTSIFVFISTIVALALFQPRMTTDKLTARQNSNAQVVFILNKIVCQFVFSFLPFQGTEIYVVMLFLLSLWQFWCYSIREPYYKRSASKFFKICSTYYFWTTLMLLVSQLLKSTGFDGALIIWLGGLPFLAVIILFESTSDVDKLFSSNLKFKTGEELQSHITYVLQLIQSQQEDKNSYMLLIGYIEKHKEICTELQCPLKVVKKKLRRGDDEQGNEIEDNCEQLLKQIQRMYRIGIKKFPDCTKLRLSFAFFHLERTKNKEKAYEQFANAAKTDPSFEQQFNIYRFRKIIRENLEDNKQNSSDLIEMIRFDNHVSLCEEAMMVSAKLNKEFWAQLKEDIPDLKKLNSIGSRITETGNAVKDNYSELSKIDNSSCEMLYSYAIYLILITQNFVEGRELLATARKLYQDKQSITRKKDLVMEADSLNKIMSPMIIVSSSSDSFGRIINFNLLFTEITGYHRQELKDRQMTAIMPKIYCSYPYSYLNLLQLRRKMKDQPQQFQQCWLAHKCNHILQAEYTVKYLPNEQELHIIFRLTTINSQRIVLLTDEDGLITDYSLSAQNSFQSLGQGMCSLSDIGLNDYLDPAYNTNSGQCKKVRMDGQIVQRMVRIEPIVIKMNDLVDEQSIQGDEQAMMIRPSSKQIVKSQLCIGYCVQMSSWDKVIEQRSDKNKLLQSKRKGANRIDQDILQLYDSPQMQQQIQTLQSESVKSDGKQQMFHLAAKIKTMRLLNNEIKMVYNDNNDGEYEQSQENQEEEDDRSMFKFDDDNYQIKLRKAINTYLNHVEVTNLKRCATLFLLSLCLLNILLLYFGSMQIGDIISYLNEIGNRQDEFTRLTSNVMATLDHNSNYTLYYNNSYQHDIAFSSDVQVQLILKDGTVNKTLKDAMIFLNSQLLQYFKNPVGPAAMSSVYFNYIQKIFPVFRDYPLKFSVSQWVSYTLCAIVLVISCVMMAYWVYIGLKIDKKRYDIMIWFLDIPIPYVSHLGTHCDKYLKEFMPSKELAQKEINFDETDQGYEEFEDRRQNQESEEIEEQIKARKSLISKNKKETLLSKINISAFKVLWMLPYGLLFSIVLLLMSGSFINDFNFLQPEWLHVATSIAETNGLYLGMEMQSLNVNAQGANLQQFVKSILNNSFGDLSGSILQSFNYNIFNFHLKEVAAIYNKVFFQNMCDLLTNINSTECNSVMESQLTAGYEVFLTHVWVFAYYPIDELRTACQQYLVPALLQLINKWDDTMTSNGNSLVSLCTILLYVFIVLSVLAFLTLGLYYLRKLNTELNQTIQMLNMIPFKLLPKSRKETKMFIAWIIREANKKKHQTD